MRLIRVLLRAKPRPLAHPDRAAEGIPDSCTDYQIRHCLGFQLVANGTGGGYTFAGKTVPLLVIAELRALPRPAITTGV